MNHMSAPGAVSTGTFNAGPDTFVAAEDLSAMLAPGHDGIGWLAQRGYVPLGYKGDAAKTAATFPVIDGVRYAVPGDRARHLADGADRIARPRLGDHQLRRREDLRRGGRDGDRVTSGRGRRGGLRPAQRAVGSGGGRRRRARRRRQRRRPGADRPRRRRRSPATSCPRRLCSVRSSNAARPARPTTGGPANRPSAAALETTARPTPPNGAADGIICAPNVISSHASAPGVANEATEVVVVRSVPVRHQRDGPLVDVVDDIR